MGRSINKRSGDCYAKRQEAKGVAQGTATRLGRPHQMNKSNGDRQRASERDRERLLVGSIGKTISAAVVICRA